MKLFFRMLCYNNNILLGINQYNGMSLVNDNSFNNILNTKKYIKYSYGLIW